MAQFVGCLEGMADACRALDYPIVSGNVSLYNESKATGGGSAILPTPAIGGVGVLEDVSKMATIGFKAAGQSVILIGYTAGQIGQSLWLRELHGKEAGSPPPVDLAVERRHGEFVRGLIFGELAEAVHDCADGGLLVAVTEMALAGNTGIQLSLPELPNLASILFGEDQGRYVVVTHDIDKVIAGAKAAGVFVMPIGTTGGDSVTGPGFAVPLSGIRAAHESFFKDWMEG